VFLATVLITGGAGFLGSHLCDAFIKRQYDVIAVDNLASGRRENVAHLVDHPQFELVQADLRDRPELDREVDLILHFASLASPPAYLAQPLMTLETGSFGTHWCIDRALKNDARMIVASTSEVYGDPAVHPQPETYWGNVNPIGPRSVYDEAKRYAEAATMAYRREMGLRSGIIRIFNTYGPRMRADDGRVVTNFIRQAIANEPITIFGKGDQTRSFCYVDDLVRGIVAMADSDLAGPINLGNPTEHTIAELAAIVVEMMGSSSPIEFHDLPVDDPTRRRPDIARAKAELDWSPSIPLAEGLRRTADYFLGNENA